MSRVERGHSIEIVPEEERLSGKWMPLIMREFEGAMYTLLWRENEKKQCRIRIVDEDGERNEFVPEAQAVEKFNELAPPPAANTPSTANLDVMVQQADGAPEASRIGSAIKRARDMRRAANDARMQQIYAEIDDAIADPANPRPLNEVEDLADRQEGGLDVRLRLVKGNVEVIYGPIKNGASELPVGRVEVDRDKGLDAFHHTFGAYAPKAHAKKVAGKGSTAEGKQTT